MPRGFAPMLDAMAPVANETPGRRTVGAARRGPRRVVDAQTDEPIAEGTTVTFDNGYVAIASDEPCGYNDAGEPVAFCSYGPGLFRVTVERADYDTHVEHDVLVRDGRRPCLSAYSREITVRLSRTST